MVGLLTVSKVSKYGWETVLPPVLDALGGADDSLDIFSLLVGSSGGGGGGGQGGGAVALSGVTIRLQVSCDLPIQVEAEGPVVSCTEQIAVDIHRPPPD